MQNEKLDYLSGYRPVITVIFESPQYCDFSRYPRSYIEFTGHQRENDTGKWIEWGSWGINFYFTTNKGDNWKKSLQYAKTWITENIKKTMPVKEVKIEWEKIN